MSDDLIDVSGIDSILSGESVIDLDELGSRDTSGVIDNLVERVTSADNIITSLREEAVSDLNVPAMIEMKGWIDLIQLTDNLNIVDLSTVIPNLDSTQSLIYELDNSLIHIIDTRVLIPLIQDDSAISRIYTHNYNGEPYKGILLSQRKNNYSIKSFIPYDITGKKIVAFFNNSMIYHVGVYSAIDIVPNTPEPVIIRSIDSLLTEVDRIIIDSKFTKKKLSADWCSLGDALEGISSTSYSTTDPNYIKKMWELNRSLCQNNE